jgi:hypothetical protein
MHPGLQGWACPKNTSGLGGEAVPTSFKNQLTKISLHGKQGTARRIKGTRERGDYEVGKGEEFILSLGYLGYAVPMAWGHAE